MQHKYRYIHVIDKTQFTLVIHEKQTEYQLYGVFLKILCKNDEKQIKTTSKIC